MTEESTNKSQSHRSHSSHSKSHSSSHSRSHNFDVGKFEVGTLQEGEVVDIVPVVVSAKSRGKDESLANEGTQEQLTWRRRQTIFESS
ncbi:hypothetical protein M0802_010997 [Mischocyttarus mexicanus]|nr:hypothetical protein M0802_010997 [Mischocyttarus mexicanus]